MAAAIPVIATLQGGALEQIEDGVTGFLVPINNAPATLEKLASLVHEPALRSKMGLAGKEKLQQQFSLATFNKNIVDQVV